jgi:putative colanic acid biosynthesis glycosyltransferase
MRSEKSELSIDSVLVVTVCKDDSEGLKRTTRSLLAQNYTEWQQIIVLTDTKDLALGTALDLEDVDERIHVKVQSGQGIYNAMNTGLENVQSDYAWFMNSGDSFKDENSISLAVQRANSLNADLLIGGYGVTTQTEKFSFPLRRYTELTFSLNRRGGCHQAMLFRCSSLTKIYYDEKYSIAADFKLALEFARLGRVFQVPDVYAEITPGGISDIQICHTLKQKQQIRVEHFGKVSIGRLTGLLWTNAVRLKVTSRKIMYFH